MNNNEWFTWMQLQVENTEDYMRFNTRDEAFAFWDGESYCNSYTRKSGRGHKN